MFRWAWFIWQIFIKLHKTWAKNVRTSAFDSKCTFDRACCGRLTRATSTDFPKYCASNQRSSQIKTASQLNSFYWCWMISVQYLLLQSDSIKSNDLYSKAQKTYVSKWASFRQSFATQHPLLSLTQMLLEPSTIHIYIRWFLDINTCTQFDFVLQCLYV